MPLPLPMLGASPCPRCRAACCTQNGHEFAVLLRLEEYARFRAFSVAIGVDDGGRTVGERVLPYADGRCQFLDGATKLCKIYDDRPGACRDFECTRYVDQDGPGRHGRFLELNPDVLGLIEGR